MKNASFVIAHMDNTATISCLCHHVKQLSLAKVGVGSILSLSLSQPPPPSPLTFLSKNIIHLEATPHSSEDIALWREKKAGNPSHTHYHFPTHTHTHTLRDQYIHSKDITSFSELKMLKLGNQKQQLQHAVARHLTKICLQ